MARKIAVFVVFACWCAAAASAQVAMLTQVSGDVQISSKDGARPAVAFLKVNENDTLTLTANARVQMVYLATGRQEIWAGGGAVDVGAQQGRSANLTVQASQVPPIILKQLVKTPAAGQHARTGMVMLRGLEDLAALDELYEDYNTFRAAAAADDTTPEVFLLTGLIELGDFEGARSVLGKLQTKQTDQPAYAPVVEHFTRLAAEAEAARKPVTR